MGEPTPVKPQPGLCADCHHARELVSGKGSRFFYCLRSESDARYAKYPALPVLDCAGYQARPKTSARE
jgi:hypothetical protein